MSRRCSLLLVAGSNRDRRSRPTVRRPQLATHTVKPRNTRIYEETSITVRPTLGPLTWWPGPVWNRGTLETVLLGAPPAHRAPQISSRRLTGLMATSRTTADATKVDLSGSPFRAWVDDEEYSGKALIISTGAKAKMLGLDSERKLLGRGVSTCATCDGFFFRSKDLAVVGGGDSALEEAIFLTRFATKVTIVHRRDRLRASKVMQDRAFANPKIDFAWNSVVEQVHGDQSVSGVRLRNLEDNSESDLGVAGVFVAIGHLPNTELFADQVELDEDGYIKVNPPGTATSVDGVFAAGDVVDHVYRQAVTAAGTGCAAAIDAERWLEAHGYDSGATTDNWD